MGSANIWYKRYLYGGKAVILILLLTFAMKGYGQSQAGMVNPNYDERKFISYGFTIGIHWSSFRIKYADEFTTIAFDTVHSIMPRKSPGFSLGFIVNMRAADLLDLRLMPKVSFYEYKVDYNFTNNDTETAFVESTVVEFPLIAKFKSQRRGNGRMYIVGGLSPGIEASGKSDIENRTENLQITGFNMNLELGFGMDMYFPLFKFSPELRYSFGLMDMLSTDRNKYSEPLERINTHVVTVYFLFQ